MILRMVTLAFANIYIRIGSTVVGALACHDRGSWFETSNLTAFSLILKLRAPLIFQREKNITQ